MSIGDKVGNGYTVVASKGSSFVAIKRSMGTAFKVYSSKSLGEFTRKSTRSSGGFTTLFEVASGGKVLEKPEHWQVALALHSIAPEYNLDLSEEAFRAAMGSWYETKVNYTPALGKKVKAICKEV